MGKEIVYCEICGDRILEQEFEKGKAITLLNKNYCSKCKDEAVKTVSLDDLEGDPEAAEERKERSSAVMKAIRSPVSPRTPARGTPAPVTKTPPRSPAPVYRARPAGSKMPLIIGGAIGAVALLILILLVAGGGGDKNGGSEGNNKGVGPNVKQAARADQAWQELQTVIKVAQASEDWDSVLGKIKHVQADLAGSKYEEELEKLRQDYEKRKREGGAAAKIAGLLDEARRLATNDPDFRSYLLTLGKYEEAEAEAARTMASKLPEVKKAKGEFIKTYDDKADAIYASFKDEIKGLMDNREWANAMAVIDARFPAAYRHSSIWKSTLERIYRECEQKAKTDRKPGSGGGGGTNPERPRDLVSAVPPLNEWVSVMSVGTWVRFAMDGEKSDSWTFHGTTIRGTCSVESEPQPAIHDLLCTTYERYSDFEMTFQARALKGEQIHVLFRLQPSLQKFVQVNLVLNRDWAEIKLSVHGGNLKIACGGNEQALDFRDTNAEGQIAFGLSPGVQAEVKDIRIKRTR